MANGKMQRVLLGYLMILGLLFLMWGTMRLTQILVNPSYNSEGKWKDWCR